MRREIITKNKNDYIAYLSKSHIIVSDATDTDVLAVAYIDDEGEHISIEYVAEDGKRTHGFCNYRDKKEPMSIVKYMVDTHESLEG